MTNAEEYLKVSKEEFLEALSGDTRFFECIKQDPIIYRLLDDFLSANVKPFITDDEECILRNLGDKFTEIYRTSDGNLYILMDDDTSIKLSQFKDHLFKFVKKGEKYNIKDLLEE